jgi:hypothetical protein
VAAVEALMGLRSLWLVVGLVSATPAGADGISGTYIGTGANSAFLVQLVETPGGQVTGRYEQTVLEPNGNLKLMIASITGASDGHTVVVTIKPTELLSGGVTASGTVEGSLLHLSGGGGGTKIELNISKSDEAAYRAQISELTKQAHRLTEGRVRADQLSRLIDLTKKILANSIAADAQLEKFPPIEQRYRAITELMNAALARQRTIYGNGQASVARSQIGVAINQAAIETEQLHRSMQDSYRDAAAKIDALRKAAREFGQLCQSAETARRTDLRTACAQFLEAAEKFTPSAEALGRSFVQVENAWVEEHGKQERILRASDVASR